MTAPSMNLIERRVRAGWTLDEAATTHAEHGVKRPGRLRPRADLHEVVQAMRAAHRAGRGGA